MLQSMTSPLQSASGEPILPLGSEALGSRAPIGNVAPFHPSSMLSGPELHKWAMTRSSQLFGSTATPSAPLPASNPTTLTGGNANDPNSENANTIPSSNQVTQFMLYSFELTCFYMFQGDQAFAQQQSQDRQNLQPET